MGWERVAFGNLSQHQLFAASGLLNLMWNVVAAITTNIKFTINNWLQELQQRLVFDVQSFRKLCKKWNQSLAQYKNWTETLTIFLLSEGFNVWWHMEIFPVHSKKSEALRKTSKREFHWCYKQILVVRIRLLICECFFMPESDFIMLVGLLSWFLLQCRTRATKVQRWFPLLTCQQLPNSESTLNSINSSRFFIAANWYAATRSHRTSGTFNLCASLFIREAFARRIFLRRFKRVKINTKNN